MQSCGAQSQCMYLQNSPVPKTQGTLRKGGWKVFKSQRIRQFSVRLCLLLISEATHLKYNQHDTKEHDKLDREKFKKPSFYSTASKERCRRHALSQRRSTPVGCPVVNSNV